MTECIEREDAIKKLDHFQSHLHTVEGTSAIRVAKTLIKQIPAADVRPVRRGKWDDKPVAFFLKCSECGCCVANGYDVFLDRGELNFCPNCGADMREEANEQHT